MLSCRWTEVDFAIIDLETHSSWFKWSCICEIACIAVTHGRVNRQDVYETLIHPGKPIHPQATKIHGITKEMLVGAPSFHEVEEGFKSRIDRKVLVMHGASHDLGKLKKVMRDFQFPLVLDTQRLFKKLDKSPTRYGLSDLFDHYHLRATLAHKFMGREACDHRACYDALGLAYLFVILLRRHKPNTTLGELKEICEYKSHKGKGASG